MKNAIAPKTPIFLRRRWRRRRRTLAYAGTLCLLVFLVTYLALGVGADAPPLLSGDLAFGR